MTRQYVTVDSVTKLLPTATMDAVEARLSTTIDTKVAPVTTTARRLDSLTPRRPVAVRAVDATITFTKVTTPPNQTGLAGTVVQLNGNDLSTFRFSSCGDGAPVNIAGGSFAGARPRSQAGGDIWGTYVLDFMVDSADWEWQYQFVQLGPGTGTGYARVFIDDVLAADWSKSPYVGDEYWLMRVTPTTRRTMHVRIETNMGNRRLNVGTNDTAWVPKKPLYSQRWVVIGDSWTVGAQDASVRGFVPGLGERLGVECLRVGYSATGYVNNGGGTAGKMTYPARIATDVTPHDPDLVLVVGSINDSGTPTQVQAAAVDTFAQIAAATPNAKIIVIGPQYGTYGGPSNATCDTMQSGLANAAAVSPNVIGVISMYGWLTGNGKIGTASTSTPKGNSEIYLATDGIHPANRAAFDYFTDRMVAEIVTILATQPLTV